MAKVQSAKKEFSFSQVGDLLNKISKDVEMIVDTDMTERTFIPTGNYIFNAALSGSLFGGLPDSGVVAFAAPEATGKTYLAANICREAQKKGYKIIYIDTEWAIKLNELTKYGISITPEDLTLLRITQIEDLNIAMTQLINQLKEAKRAGDTIPKMMWVVDSLAQLSSRKMKEDLVKGEPKADMQKAKAIASFFVSITGDINYLQIPLLINNQVYNTMEMFSQTVMKGGNQLRYSANIICFLDRAKLKEDDMDEMDLGQSGIIVTAKCVKNRLAKPKKVKFHISFNSGMNPFIGLDAFCRDEYFNDIGIGKGKYEVDKSTGEMIYKPGGNRWFVRHLDKYVSAKNLFSPSVFTDEVLEKLDVYVKKYFAYTSVAEMTKYEEDAENQALEFMDADDTVSIDASKFFED
jgi:RecA/RadA recombinase